MMMMMIMMNSTGETAQFTNRIAKLENEGKRCLQVSWLIVIILITIILFLYNIGSKDPEGYYYYYYCYY